MRNVINKSKIEYLALAFWILMIVLYSTQAIINNRLADDGEKLLQIQQQEQELRLQNMLLEDQVAKAESLQTITKEATQMGLSDNSKASYLK